MTLVDHEYFPGGTQGSVASRWIGTIYAVRLADGHFHWMDSSELDSVNPDSHSIVTGGMAVVTSDKHQHKFIKKGDIVQVVRVIDEADYYGVKLNDELHWLIGFELAPYIPPVAP